MWEYSQEDCPDSIVQLYLGDIKVLSNSSSSYVGGLAIVEGSEKAVAAKSAKEDRTSKPAAAAAGKASAAAAGKTLLSRFAMAWRKSRMGFPKLSLRNSKT